MSLDDEVNPNPGTAPRAPKTSAEGVDYGYGVVPYTPPKSYTPGGYLDPNRPVPGNALNNLYQRTGLEIERQLVSGSRSFGDLTGSEREMFAGQMERNKGYFTPGNTYKTESVASLNDEFKKYLESRGSNQFHLPGWMSPLEWAGSKMYEIYSKYMSRPVSSMILYASQADRGNWDYGDAWDAAKYTSPAQAAWMMFMTDDEMRNNGIDPHDIGGEQSRKAVDSYFSHGIQSYVTGLGDFAVSWYADPLVIAGRGLGVAREITYAKGTDFAPSERMLATASRITGRPNVAAGTAHQRNIEYLLQSGSMSGLTDLVEKFKLKYDQDVAVARITKQIPSFFKSKNGSGARFAEALVKAKDADEVDTILRLSLGDITALARVEFLSDKTAAALRASATSRMDMMDNYATIADKSTPQAERLAKKIEDVNREVVRLDNDLGNLSRQMDIFGKLDRMYFNSVTTPLGAKMRGSFYDINVAWAKVGEAPRTVMGVPLALGKVGRFAAGTRLAYNGLYVAPMRFVRSFTDDSPMHYIKVDDPDSHRAVTALLRDASTLSPDFKAMMTGRYINASPAERPMILAQIEMEATAAMGSRHGLNYSEARKAYEFFYGNRASATAAAPKYSTGVLRDGTQVQVVDKLGDGSIVTTSPVLTSQMADSWVMMDFKYMDKVLKLQAPVIKRILADDPNALDKIRRGVYSAKSGLAGAADGLNGAWKFLQLARAGYGPRAIADEFMGQIAYAGIFNFLARTGKGIDNNFFRGAWMRPGRESQEMIHQISNDLVINQSAKVEKLQRNMAINNERQRNPNIRGPKRRELMREYDTMARQLDNELESLTQIRANHSEMQVRRTMIDGAKIDGRGWAGPLEREGKMFIPSLSAERTMLNNGLSGHVNAARRSHVTPGNADWKEFRAVDNEEAHTSAWLRAVNNQIRNDDLALMRASGKTEEEMTVWLTTPKGQEYRRTSPFAAMTLPQIAERVAAHTDQYLPPTMTGRDVIGANIVHRDLTGDELKAALPKEMRPDVHLEQAKYALGRGTGDGSLIAEAADTAMRSFYKVMNQLPAERLSRNPLFAQMYHAELRALSAKIPEDAVLTPRQYLAYENAARARALGIVKRFTFSLDYETRISHSLRFVAPFFGAQAESWARWARVSAEKPQTIPHLINLYNSPARSGMATTYDGDKVDGYGYATNAVTGERYKVNQSETFLNVPIPKALLPELASMTGRDVESFRIPMASLNLIMNSKVPFMPAWGPVVQIPASDFLTGGKLSPFEHGQWQHEGFFKELGILPYGPRGSADWWDYINPASGKRMADSENEYGDKFQKTLAAVMAEENWKYDEGLRDTKPTLKENLDRARQFTKFEFWSNFVLPFTASARTPHQFYGDMYRKMVKADPERGADRFRDKYGDSMWRFTAQLTRNNASISATSRGAMSSVLMQEAVDLADPEFAGDVSHILSGPYATGDWSASAYFYQLNSPIQSGGTENQREKIGAIEAISRAEQSQGWYQYNKQMLKIQSEMYRRGLSSLDDAGAEDLKDTKKAVVAALSNPFTPDGRDNPYYNKSWSKSYNTLDRNKYDRFAATLENVMQSTIPRALASDNGRTDLNSLMRYLDMRRQAMAELGGRESQNINAKSNSDIKRAFARAVNQLMERDTRFNELHNRYFSRDMGFGDDDY